ncbi:MAG: hypothetical protein JO083_04835 [Candidatus Eremiobacteraeota bacterium]|nr:hypothetical protein [Candidatus Eremiobacteraeota bacterium]MBV8368350.1 hypothetical protein [Candidatus Eremiobacteraeota bacterium]
MRHALVPGAALVLFCSTLATPAGARPVPAPHPSPRPTPSPPARAAHRLTASALYARRSRRLVQSYLRLKLLEMREVDLERARKVVERKLGIRALLGETPPPSAR